VIKALFCGEVRDPVKMEIPATKPRRQGRTNFDHPR
jgi:hypothetical protein